MTMQSETTKEIANALVKAQSAMKAAVFNKINPHFKNRYADLSAVLDAVRAPLADNGIAITQTTEMRDGGFVLITTLRHSSGQWIASEYPLPVAAKPQELGSALTYARRYSISCIACISSDEDDDAEGSRKNNQASSAPKRPAPPAPNIMQHDPFTGEVVSPQTNPAGAAPAVTAGANEKSTPIDPHSLTPAEDYFSREALKGTARLNIAWQNFSPAERKELQGKKEHYKKIAAQIDAKEGAEV